MFIIILFAEKCKIFRRVKRYSNIFFFLFSFLCFAVSAKPCTFSKVNSTVYNSHQSDISRSHEQVMFQDGRACPTSNMQEKKPHNEYVIILFRLGIEGKYILLSGRANMPVTSIYDNVKGASLIRLSGIKYIVSSSHFVTQPPEFLSAFSFRPPPALC